MSTRQDLSAGRQALREALRELEAKALHGRDRACAIKQANEPRTKKDLPLLKPTTVGGWFESGTPAKAFETLWALVEVLLEWSGQQRPEALAGPDRAKAVGRWTSARKLWETLYTQARSRRVGAPRADSRALRGYLTAVRQTAGMHPYPDARLPALTDLYVRQQAQPSSPDGSPLSEDAASAAQELPRRVPAEEVFRSGSGICVLLAPAGSGKSTLLRAYRNDCAAAPSGRTDTAVPVLLNAAALTDDSPLPAALAQAANSELTRFGLLDQLTADLFRNPPRPKTPWLVLVDGLDEIPDADTRRDTLRMLANAAAAEPGLYQLVIATRPLPPPELDFLGEHTTRFELQPFTPSDLQTYAYNWFHGLDDAHRHAEAFITRLMNSRMEVLACIPLMATMLCQLYAADPARPLPEGRTGAYREFVELIYEQNTHKRIKDTHDQAIRVMKDRHQIPQDNQDAELAAQQVRNHLPELIDHLAHERINGKTTPAVEILVSHLRVNRPDKVTNSLWNSFLGDLLRPTGLLAQRAEDFVFLHQTLLEYHAARHATRDEQARSQLLQRLVAESSTQPPFLAPSYLGFLLDGLLAPRDRVADETIHYLKQLTRKRNRNVDTCSFMVTQTDLRTNLPPTLAGARLARLAKDTTLGGRGRVQAATALMRLDGHRDTGIALLNRLACLVPSLGSWSLRANVILAQVDEYRELCAGRLARFADDATANRIYGSYRVEAAAALAEVDGHRDAGAIRLARLARNPIDSFKDNGVRVQTVKERYRGADDAELARVARLAVDTVKNSEIRFLAAEALARVDGYRDSGATELARLANDTTVESTARVQAAKALARVDGYQDEGTAWLARFANDTAQSDEVRVGTAEALTGEAGAAQLTRLAGDTAVNGPARMRAAELLVHRNGYEEAGADQLARIADDTTPSDFRRVEAAKALAALDGYREAGAARLACLADDTTMNDHDGLYRMHAAKELAWLDGHQEAGVVLLARLAADATLPDGLRERVVEYLVQMGEPWDIRAVLLAGLAADTTLNHGLREQATQGLAQMSEQWDARAAELASLLAHGGYSDDLHDHVACELARMDGHREAGAVQLARLADDTI